MSRSETLIQKYDLYGATNYHPLPVVLKTGRGSRVWDVDGKSYLDFLSCYSALNFGHGHPRLTQTLVKQMHELGVCSRAFHSEQLSLFSEEICVFTGLDQVLPMNSGAEAVETAIKLARKWGYQNKKVPSDKAKILTFQNNFHGRTITIVSFSTEDNYRAGFGPYTPGFDVVEFDDLAAAEKAIDANTVGVLVEPIQAEAGIIVPKDGYLKGLRKLCDTKGVLLMLDEIQTGMGRTGQDFCYQHEGIQPDLLILGKSLGGGLLPISAVIGKHDVMKVIQPGQHGSTFGGNPLACAVAREALKVLRQEELSERANQVGQWIRRELSQAKLPHVREIRGKGALIGIELDESSGGARKYCERMMEKGVLCKETHTYVIRIAPPLIISESEIQKGIEVIIETIQSLGQGAR